MSRAASTLEAGASSGRTIGEILLARGVIGAEELDEAVAAQHETGKPLGQILVEAGTITRLELASALAEQWGDAATVSPTFPGGSAYVDPTESTGDTLAQLEELARNRRALEARLVEFERAATDTRWQEELGRGLEQLFGRVEVLDSALAALQQRGDDALLVELRLAVTQLAQRTETMTAEAAELRTHVAELATVDALDRGLAELAGGLDGAISRMIEAEARAGEASEQVVQLTASVAQIAEEVRQSLHAVLTTQEELSRRIDGTASAADLSSLREVVTGLAPSVADLGTSVAELRSSLQGLAVAPHVDPEARERLDVLATDVAAAAARIEAADRGDELTAVAETIEALRADVAALAERPAGDPELAARVAELAERIELGAGTVAAEGEPDPRVDALIARVAEIAAHPQADPELADAVALLTERIEELGRRVAEHDGVQPAGLDEALITGFEARLDAVEARFEHAAGDAIEARLAELSAAIEALGGARAAESREDDAVREIGERLAAVDRATDELREAHARAEAAWAGERRTLEARLEALAARLDGEVLAGSAARAAVSIPATSPTGAASADADLERLRMAVERLMLDFAEHRRLVSAAVPARDLDQRLRELGEQVEALADTAVAPAGAAGGDAGAGDRVASAQLKALAARLEEIEASAAAGRETMIARLERMMGTIDWRLQRLENGDG